MLLIIQNGYLGTFISRYLDEDYEIIKSFETDVSQIDLNLYSIIIILGGHQSIATSSFIDESTDKSNEKSDDKSNDNSNNKFNDKLDDKLQNVVSLIRKCVDINKPVFGICLGCQLIAHALGCEVKFSGKLNVGYDTNVLGFDNIFRCHHDYVVPNDAIEVIDIFESMPYVFKHNKLIGIQCHPDIPPDCVIKYQDSYSIRNTAKEKYQIIEKNNQAFISQILAELRSL